MATSIIKYLAAMEANKKSPKTIQSTKGVLIALDKFKPIDKIQKDDLIKFFSEFKGADSSRNLYIVVIKKYFRDNNKEELISWLKPISLKETIKSDDILTIEDINNLIENTDNLYFKALIAFLYESGARISEVTELKYNDFKPTTDGLIVNIKTTKTGAGYRKIILPFSSQYIMNLKTSIYAKDYDIVFKYQYNYMRDTLMEIAEKSGINKRVNPHSFRHAQATLMVQKGYNETIMKKKLGWSGTSKMVARYSHISDEDVINSTLEIEGRKSIEKKPMEILNEAKPLSIDQAANRLFQLEDENTDLKNIVSKQENRLEEIEKTMEHMVNAMLEGKLPEGLFLDKDKKKIVIKQ